MINIPLKVNRDFEKTFNFVVNKYGEDFECLNGFHEKQLDHSEFIDNFIDKNVADSTIDSNANVSNKDIRALMNEKGKSQDKILAFNKIFYELNKKYNLATAKKWLELEYNGAFYLHDAHTSTFLPYCFIGETKILTNYGIKRLDELVGKNIKVLNKNHGWEDATVQYFGKAEIRTVTLERYGVYKTIGVTGNHKWFVKTNNGKKILSTDELQQGMKIPFNTCNTWCMVNPSPFGVAHGFYIGDGDKGNNMRANFCGDKSALIPYFTPYSINGSEKELTIAGIPYYFKQFPSLEETHSYLYGWLSGYFAADGCVDDKGRCTISSVNYENLEYVRNVLCVLGMPVNEIRYQDRISNLTGEFGRVYILTLSEEYLQDNFFIRPQHIKRIQENRHKNDRKNRNWNVVSVTNTGYITDVFCAVVPETESFTLDNNVLTHNCYAYDLTRLATEGLFFLKNYNNEPPKHLTTFTDDVIEYISFMSNRSSGAVGIPNVLIWVYYFWKNDVKNGYYIKSPEYYLKQTFQKLIYRLNQPFMRVSQSAFVNCSIFDRNYIESLFGGMQYPDGSYVIDQIEEIIKCQKQFMNVVSEIRTSNLFTFPVITYSLLFQNGKFVDEKFAKWCSDHNTEWNDANFFVSEDVGTLSNCCRLLSNTKKLNAFINSIGGTALSIGSIKVNTINLMRIALESGKNTYKFIEILKDRTKLCCQVLEVIRNIIKRNIEKGLLPNYQDGAVEMDKQYNTVGILGLFEVIEYFGFTKVDEFGYTRYTDDGIEFADSIFRTINDIKDNFSNDYSINVESVPAERAAVILCQKDNLLYDLHDKFIYSNQWIPLSTKCTIKDKLRLSSLLDKKCSGGSIAHINLESNFPNKETAWDMLNTIAKSGVIYFAFNTRINECENHHGFVGTDICPNCGKPVFDTYQRIVGYLVPSRSYSKDRLREYKSREWYSMSEMLNE